MPEAARGDRRPTSTARRGIERRPDQVVVTPGAKPIMFYAILALIERGRRGHLPEPRLPDLRVDDALRRARTAVPLPLREENDFRFDLDELARAGHAADAS